MVVGSLPEKPVPVDTPVKFPEPSEQSDETAGGAESGKEMTFYGLLTKHAKFLNDVAKLQVSDLILPLRELAHYDSQVRGCEKVGASTKEGLGGFRLVMGVVVVSVLGQRHRSSHSTYFKYAVLGFFEVGT